MKTVSILIILLVSFCTTTNAQGLRKIPATVTEAFKTQYPDATHVSWKDKTTGFEAGYEWQGKKMFTKFSGKGEWMKTETLLNYSELNSDVQTGLQKSKYHDWAIKEVKKLDIKSDKHFYVIEVRKSAFQKKNLYFNEKGELQKDHITI